MTDMPMVEKRYAGCEWAVQLEWGLNEFEKRIEALLWAAPKGSTVTVNEVQFRYVYEPKKKVIQFNVLKEPQWQDCSLTKGDFFIDWLSKGFDFLDAKGYIVATSIIQVIDTQYRRVEK